MDLFSLQPHSDAESRHRDPICLSQIDKVICLGLGSLATGDFSVTRSRPQFAFLLLLLDLIQSGRSEHEKDKLKLSIGICDPLFTPGDAALARHFGFEILENLCGYYSASCPLPALINSSSPQSSLNEDDDSSKGGMLCFMPHCPKELYASLLDANWTPQNLSKLVVIGNSFESITSSPSAEVEKLRNGRIFAADRVQKLATFPDYDDPFIFNNTAIHTFEKASLIEHDDAFWSVTEKERDALKSVLVRS